MIIFRKLSKNKIVLAVFFVTVFAFQMTAQYIQESHLQEEIWIDSIYNSLNLEERIAQLIFVRANYSGKPYLNSVDTLISKYNIGGVVFF
tara:strand:- start:212 stop:481 length:270 start_codon:yes stop_codon:yes gene_type:complete